MASWNNGGFQPGAAPGGSSQMPMMDGTDPYMMGSPYNNTMQYQGSPYQQETSRFVGPQTNYFQPNPQPIPQQRKSKGFFSGLFNLSIPSPEQSQPAVFPNGDGMMPQYGYPVPGSASSTHPTNRNLDALSPIPDGANASAAQSPAAFSTASGEDGKPRRNTSKRTGRPPIWTPQKTRQLIRNYLWSPSKLPRTLQFFHQDENPGKEPMTEAAAKKQQNGAQKKLNQTIVKDPRALKGNDKDQQLLEWRVNLPARSPRHQQRVAPPQAGSGSLDRQHTAMSIKMGAVTRSFSGLSVNSRKAFSLLKNLTIKSEPDSTISRQVTAIDPTVRHEAVAHDDEVYVPLPGDLLTLDLQSVGANYILRPDGEETNLSLELMWAEMRDEPNIWVTPSGPSPKAQQTLLKLANSPSSVDLLQADCFGNTILHFLASRKDQQNRLLSLFDKTSIPFSALSAKNTARQTFLHVLAREWFVLSGGDAPILKLIGKLEATDETQRVVNRLVLLKDVYGQTLFHRIKLSIPDPGASDMIQAIETMTVCSQDGEYFRDAFGSLVVDPSEPLPHPLEQGQRPGALVSGEVTVNQDNLPCRPYAALTPGVDVTQYIVSRANMDKHVEDGMGNGALHCLAALAGRAQPGRKRKASEPLDPGRSPGGPMGQQGRSRDTTPGEAMGSPVSPSAATMGGVGVPEDPMTDICRQAEELLSKGCSISHYDRSGRTALMAFIEHLPSDTLKMPILKIVVEAAKREDMLEARSREGETALLFASRLGKIAAVRELAAAGANQYARSPRHGRVRGVLGTIQHEQAKHKHDPAGIDTPWGRLEASLKVLAVPEKDSYALAPRVEPKLVRFPDVIDEWGIPLQ